MTDYTKLVEDLRYIEKTMFALGTTPINIDNVSIKLAYDKKWGRTAKDAAAAIEALQAEVDEAKQHNTDLLNMKEMTKEEEDEILEYILTTPVGTLEPIQIEQLPKRGKWVEENRRPRSSKFVCSECHRTAYDPQPTRDKAWRKRCIYAYCPNCGAKMEVQE